MANGKKKKSKKKLFIFGGLGLLILILVIVTFAGGSKENIILVQTEKVQKRNITQTVTATGKIDPEFKVLITPEVTGEIISLPVKEGDVVKKGDLLIKIKGDQYMAQKDRLEASLKSSEASLQMRDAELNRVQLEYDRTQELHSKALASDSELEAVQSNYLSAKASYDAAAANVLQSKAQLREVLETLYKTTIYSPIDGIVIQLNVELAERVLGSGFSQGTNIMTVADLSNMEAVVNVDENDVVLVSVGDTTNITVDAFGDKVFNGIVTEIGNSAISAGFGTQEQVVNFSVKIKLIDLDPYLRPGMSCNADIETETVENVISVPIQSVTARTDVPVNEDSTKTDEKEENGNRMMKNKKPKEVVFLVDNGKAKMVVVEAGISDDNYLEIKSGLDEGAEVVSGSYRVISRELEDDSVVRVEQKRGDGNKEMAEEDDN
ncbi:MAG: efflux RND transporter periplasmic adaptor subunit [Ignavibacteria bacterium]|nr:efflux RND transporter periplasmic adaptor subunit [Ignavibacteria bacterium]